MITTERLILRPWRLSDLPHFIDMNKDMDVMRFFPRTLTVDESREAFERVQAHQALYGFCFWAAELKETGLFIGFIGLKHTDFDAHFTPCIEIGWRLMKEYWGQGLAPEGATACLEWAFERGMEEIYSFTPHTNLASQRVMQKIGMDEIGTFGHPKVDPDSPLHEHVLYYISANGTRA